MNFAAFDVPFRHWLADRFIDRETIAQINAQWPAKDFPGWRIENGKTAKKASVLFPSRLPEAAQTLAAELTAPKTLRALRELTGIDLVPDPWLLQGPQTPRLGGGLHEIYRGGRLGMHLDFNVHPSGLTRCLNLLIYLNEKWDLSWGGALELHGDESVKTIWPHGGLAVLFQTTEKSWHGHPYPLTCPPDKSRRSLALYFYCRTPDKSLRPTTVYRK